MLIGRTLTLLALAVAVVAAVDYGHQQRQFMRQMRMSRREVQDELKQSDGDPHVKQRFRATAAGAGAAPHDRRRAQEHGGDHQPDPLRGGAALRGRRDARPRRCWPRAWTPLALKIREIAAANGMPVIENPPLARALHAGCEIGDMIPPAHYQAVAEIISYVLRLGERP